MNSSRQIARSSRAREPFGTLLAFARLAAFALLTLSVSCGGGGGVSSGPPPPPPPPVQSISITTNSPLPHGLLGQNYSVTLQATGGTPPLTWSLRPGYVWIFGLSMSTSGVISGIPTAPFAAAFPIEVRDSAGHFAAKSLNLSCADPLAVVTTSLVDGNIGVPYSAQVFATGGIEQRWSLAQGSSPLPTGLSINSMGQILGTPLESGTFNFVVQVTDGSFPSQVASKSVTLFLKNDLVVTSHSLRDGVEDQPYSQTLQALGGALPYSWSVTAGSFAPGMNLDPSTGIISGSPQIAGPVSITAQVSDSSTPAQSASASFSFRVQPPLAIVTASFPDAPMDVVYGQSVVITGGIVPYTLRLKAGALPPGLMVSSIFPNNMSVQGTATAIGTFNFTLEAADSSSPPLTATRDLSLRVNPRLLVTTSSLPTGLVGHPYNTTLTATGGVLPYTWTAFGFGLCDRGCVLPAGMVLDPTTGVIDGTPIEPFGSPTQGFVGLASISVKDSGNLQQSAGVQLTLQIVDLLKVSTTQLPPTKVGEPVQMVVGVSGGTPPYVWSLVSGALPSGLAFNSASAEISGTPSVVEAQTFTLQVTDSGTTFPQSHQRALTLSVVTAPGRNDSIPTATPLSFGRYRASLSPHADPATGPPNPDNDYYRITADAGTRVRVEIFGERLIPSSPIDAVIEILDATGTRYRTCRLRSGFISDQFFDHCMNDDGFKSSGLDSQLDFEVPGTVGTPVTFFVRVLDWSGSARPDFRYEIAITPIALLN